MIRKASEEGSRGWTRSDSRSSDLFKRSSDLFKLHSGIHSICWTMTRDSFWTRFGSWSKSWHCSESGPWYERPRV